MENVTSSKLGEMSEGLLKEVQAGGFLPLTLTLAPLQNILEQVIKMIKEQGDSISILTNKVEQKADKSEIPEAVKREVQACTQGQINQIAEAKKQIDDFGKELEGMKLEISELKTYMDWEEEATAEEETHQEEEVEKEEEVSKLVPEEEVSELVAEENAEEVAPETRTEEEVQPQIEKPPHAKEPAPRKRTKSRRDPVNEEIESLKNDVAELKKAVSALSDEINRQDLEYSGPMEEYTELEIEEPYTEHEADVNVPDQAQSVGRSVFSRRGSLAASESGDSGEPNLTPHPPAVENRNRLSRRASRTSVICEPGPAPVVQQDFTQEIEALKIEIDELKQGISLTKEDINIVKQDVDARPDRLMVEQLFAQFKKSFAGIIEMFEVAQSQSLNYATVEDVERIEGQIRQINNEAEEAAAARRGMTCLSCGQHYKTLTNAIQDPETKTILGAAPISQVVPSEQHQTFVYGTDRELYYSSSPRAPFSATKPF